MKVGDAEAAGFTILDDWNRMIGNVTVWGRERVQVDPVGSYRDADPLSVASFEMQAFAEAEARRLGMIDEA